MIISLSMWWFDLKARFELKLRIPKKIIVWSILPFTRFYKTYIVYSIGQDKYSFLPNNWCICKCIHTSRYFGIHDISYWQSNRKFKSRMRKKSQYKIEGSRRKTYPFYVTDESECKIQIFISCEPLQKGK